MSFDPYNPFDNARAAMARLRAEFMYADRTRTVRLADRHAKRAESAVERCHTLGRPGYTEARGFTRDRWQLDPESVVRMRTSNCGREKPYGMRRPWWREFWLAVKHSFLSGWHDARGTEVEERVPNPRTRAIIKGITS